MRAKARKKKAEVEANAAALQIRRAAQDSAAALRDLALALGEQVRELGIDDRAGELAGRVRDSEALQRAVARADELSARLRDTDAYRNTRENANRATASGLTALGAWLTTGDRAKRLGVRPAKGGKRTSVLWLLAGTVGGFAAGTLAAPKRGGDLRSDFSGSSAGFTDSATGGGLEDVSPPSSAAGQATRDTAAAPASQKPLADEIRTRLGEDPRTADLPKLNINVAENTVFVRGAVPQGFDQDQIRSVITTVPGVQDVDLQLTTS